MHRLIPFLVALVPGVANAQVHIVPPSSDLVKVEVIRPVASANFELVVDDGASPDLHIPSTRVTQFDRLADSRLAMVLLVESTSQFLATTTAGSDNTGAFTGFGAIDDVNRAIGTLATVGPPNRRSVVAVIPFAPSATTETPTPADELPAQPIKLTNTQVLTSSLDDGITKAVEILRSHRSARKVIVVIGDGESSLNESLRSAWLAPGGFEVHAIEIVPPSRLQAVRASQKNLRYDVFRPYGLVVWGTQASDVANLASSVRTQIESMMQVEFRLPPRVLDGNDHDLSVRVDNVVLGTTTGRLPLDTRSAHSSVSAPIVVVLIGGVLVLVGLVALVVYLRRKRRLPPVVSIATPIYVAPQPTQVLPAKAGTRGTRVLRPAGLCAWLVEVIDDVPRRTLVLDVAGATTIGRSADAHIRFAHDEFMSDRHAQIECIGSAFTITNLSKTTPAKVRKGAKGNASGFDKDELEDNDELELGTTRLIFKCVKPKP